MKRFGDRGDAGDVRGKVQSTIKIQSSVDDAGCIRFAADVGDAGRCFAAPARMIDTVSSVFPGVRPTTRTRVP